MSAINPAHYSQCGCHTAQGDRQVSRSLVCVQGVAPGTGFDTVGNAAPPLFVAQADDPDMTVTVGSGNAFIEGHDIFWQGMYHVSNDGPIVLPIDPSDPSLDRWDLIVAQVRDSTYAGSDCDWQVAVIKGTPGSPAIEPSPPVSSITLAAVLIPAGAVVLTQDQIVDRRTPYEVCTEATYSTPTRLTVTANQTIDFANTYPNVKRAMVRMMGGGGAAGGATTTSAGEVSWGAGGGAGGYMDVEIFPGLLPLGVLVCVVGTPGAAHAGAAGGDGTQTSISDGSITVAAHGGSGGAVSGANSGRSYGAAGSGGPGGGVDVLAGNAWVGFASYTTGNDGDGGWNDGDGGGIGGTGGKSQVGNGGNGKSAASSGNGNNAQGAGAGGGGAMNLPSQASTRSGGVGGSALLQFMLYEN